MFQLATNCSLLLLMGIVTLASDASPIRFSSKRQYHHHLLPLYFVVLDSSSRAAPVPAPTPEDVPAVPTPPAGGGGQDVDGDGNLDSFEYVGCFEIGANEVFDFNDLDGDDDMTPTVISLLQIHLCWTSDLFPGVMCLVNYQYRRMNSV